MLAFSCQNLAADIVYNRPENPLQHIVDKLERSRDNQASKEQDRSPGLSSELLFWRANRRSCTFCLYGTMQSKIYHQVFLLV